MTARKAVKLTCDEPLCRRQRVHVVPATGGNGIHIAREAARVFGWTSDETMNEDWCPLHRDPG